VRLVVIHRWFIAHCYRRGCPAVALLATPSPALRPPGSFLGLLGADGTWICGIGRLWGVRLIFGWVQRKPWLSLAPKQQVDTGDQVLQLLEGGISELLVGEQLLIVG
jgi:hypothetical protein